MRWFPSLMLSMVALAIGCASSNELHWVRANTTDQQRERDKAECLFDSAETLPSPQGPRRRVNQDRYHRCLEARGYQLTQIPASP